MTLPTNNDQLTDAAKREIEAAVKAVKEDRIYAAVMAGRKPPEPTDPPKPNDPPKPDPKPDPPKPTDPQADPPPPSPNPPNNDPPKKAGLWWGDRLDDE